MKVHRHVGYLASLQSHSLIFNSRFQPNITSTSFQRQDDRPVHVQKGPLVVGGVQRIGLLRPQLTTRILTLLDPQPNDLILDIGCGDGELSAQIAPLCRAVVGWDNSESFIESAEKKYGQGDEGKKLQFDRVDCSRLKSDGHASDNKNRFDRVFSNAALHWILREERQRRPFFIDIYNMMKPGGTFVFEMGGTGNVAELHAALRSVLLLHYGKSVDAVKSVDPWFFASEDWMQKMLAFAGFVDVHTELEYRPTKLDPDDGCGNGGLAGWLKLMGASFLDLLDSDAEKSEAVAKVCEILQPIVTEHDGSQWVGYVRLRANARKPEYERGMPR